MALSDLNALLGTGLQNLTNNKLNQLTNRNAFLQQSGSQSPLENLFNQNLSQTPAQQSLANLFNPKQKSAQELAAQLLQGQSPQTISAPELAKNIESGEGKALEQSNSYKALGIKQNTPSKLTADQKNKLQSYVDTIAGYKQIAQDQNLTLDRMEQLIDEGELPIAAFYTLFKNMEEKINPAYAAPIGGTIGGILGGALGAAGGGPGGAILGGVKGASVGGTIGSAIGGLISPIGTMLKYAQRQTSPDTEEFEKLSASFIRGVKSIFGSRISNLDIQEFLKTIPTLANTDAGKKAIISNMRLMLKANNYRYKALRQILAKNKGELTQDLHFQVDRIAGDKIKQLAKRFKTGSKESKKAVKTAGIPLHYSFT